MGPFPPSYGNLYIILALDYVSKWVEVVACPRNDANTVVGFFQRNILTRYGAPRTIISDEGSHFANKLFAKLMRKYGEDMLWVWLFILNQMDKLKCPLER